MIGDFNFSRLWGYVIVQHSQEAVESAVHFLQSKPAGIVVYEFISEIERETKQMEQECWLMY